MSFIKRVNIMFINSCSYWLHES